MCITMCSLFSANTDIQLCIPTKRRVNIARDDETKPQALLNMEQLTWKQLRSIYPNIFFELGLIGKMLREMNAAEGRAGNVSCALTLPSQYRSPSEGHQLPG